MNFKEEYQKSFEDISADDVFKKRLEKELIETSARRRRISPYVGTVAAAAALAIMVGAVHYTDVLRDTGESHSMKESLVAQESSGIYGDKDVDIQPDFRADGDRGGFRGQTFSTKATWCEGIENDAEKYELFLELLGSEEVEKVYVTDVQGFAEDKVMETEEIVALADKLRDAVPAESVAESNVMYYKAVLKDNRTIVFQIWNEEYVRISGVETVYKIEGGK